MHERQKRPAQQGEEPEHGAGDQDRARRQAAPVRTMDPRGKTCEYDCRLDRPYCNEQGYEGRKATAREHHDTFLLKAYTAGERDAATPAAG